MSYTIAQKIIKNHLVCGEMITGTEIGLKIDQTLTQDATGTMVLHVFGLFPSSCTPRLWTSVLPQFMQIGASCAYFPIEMI